MHKGSVYVYVSVLVYDYALCLTGAAVLVNAVSYIHLVLFVVESDEHCLAEVYTLNLLEGIVFKTAVFIYLLSPFLKTGDFKKSVLGVGDGEYEYASEMYAVNLISWSNT